MGKLNAPRTVPYEFKVFEEDGVVWLFDNSTRTYLCSSEPHIFVEPLYSTVPDWDLDADTGGGYRNPEVAKDAKPVPGEYPLDMNEEEAWQAAAEEAHANHIL